ncbi:MAG: hypothetical protein N3G48_01480 [Sulfolobales archaeon]|nr:hypothetical protein [Sulfolobales archaeon]
MIKQLRKGQAEVIGGLMVVSVLLLIIIPLILNTMTSSTNVGTRNYVLRSQFEIERWSERLVLSADKTRLENPSTVEVTIVRIWRNISGRSDPYDLPRPINISVGGYLPINQLVNNLTELEAVVTARGRVIKIQELLPPSQGGEGGEGGEGGGEEAPLGLTGEEITGGTELFNYNISVLTCRYSDKDDTCSNPIPAIYYNRSGIVGWWVNRSGGWILLPSNDISSSPAYSDLDNNKATELVVLHNDSKTKKYVVLEDNARYEFSILIRNYTYLKSETKLVAVYLKVLTGSRSNFRADTFINVTLVKSDRPQVKLSSYATLSSIKISKSDINVTIYEGYALFPVKQFNYFNTTIANNPGYYDVIIEVQAQRHEGSDPISSSIEYVAVVSS